MKSNSQISFSDAPLDVQLKYYKSSLQKAVKEELRLKKELENKTKEIKKILEFHRKEKEYLIDKIATPLSIKDSKTRTIKYIKSVGMWTKYLSWLMIEKGYVMEKEK